MKIGKHQSGLSSSEFRIMGAVHGNNRVYAASVMEVFRAIYQTSRQPLKKVTGLHMQMASMVKRGLLNVTRGPVGQRYTEDRYWLTPAGLKAAEEYESECRVRHNPWKIG